ncbi:NAD-dependent succinate-semialdehyde dehydrogenase [Pseudonocardia alaniniphila]|uniref:NAD-dependent succinate-semialdehyde dehydrogenase n=1 Tax=Pseudonocardia alaniniphila TaxID=75291 RepID=A0ABS9TCP7_9PSEU|nr:NAD-dependent succinate-semialdehyde dehydrogenase [Pseudonocardia alaniniphila]MCH6166319.1 NAD-dependent succinate-semialdehyde dehydrogenase [Pseudonocardia alaniniphila]
MPDQLFIGGEWRDASDGRTIDVLDPATEQVVATVPDASDADLDAVLAAADSGFDTWRRASPTQRSEVLARAASLLLERTEEIAAVLTQEQGKPLDEARAEVRQSAEQFSWFAGEAVRAYGRVLATEPGRRSWVERRPVGPVAAFTAWNFPASLPARKLAPAVAFGCSIVVCPAVEAPRTAMELVATLADAGVPDGVVNLITGEPPRVSARLIESDVIAKISLTGSVPVGRQLVRLSAERLQPLTLELGGHAPVLVLDDLDDEAVDRAAAAVVRSKFRNAGQVCISPSRIFVQDAVHDRLVAAVERLVGQLRVGPGTDPGSDVGPLANARRRAAVAELVEKAAAGGATVRCGGRAPDGPGFFFLPTVLTDVPADAAVLRDEPFGPVLPVLRFGTLDEGLDRANNVPYGLAAYVYTTDLGRADAAVAGLDVGMIGVNETALASAASPFGGVGLSGYGREGGTESIEAYTVATAVTSRGRP